MNERRVPLTALGWWALAAAVTGMALGWWLGWIEFVVLGVGCAAALLAGIGFILGSHELVLSRSLAPTRVRVRQPARSILTIHNPGAKTCPARMIFDRIGPLNRSVEIPSLGGGETMQHRDLLPTGQRGVFRIGPARMAKADPLGLYRRDYAESQALDLCVHPDHVYLAPIRAGLAKDLEGPTFDTSPAGDVSFHTLREYTPSDDFRQIHWMSTARVGQLMVRHNVDNRRPYLGVVVDGRVGAMTQEQFELALSAATSLLVSAQAESRPIAVWVGAQQVITNAEPASLDDALDRLAVSTQSPDAPDFGRNCQVARRVDIDVSALVLVTGAADLDELVGIVTELKREVAVIVVRIRDEDDEPLALPNAPVLDCASLDELSARWAQLVA